MRILTDKERGGWLIRLMTNRWAECAYLAIGLSGLCLEVSLPTTWHESRRGWLRIGLGLFRVGVTFPWYKSYPDYMQCAGPTFGFVFFGDALHLHWGQGQGTRDDPMTIIAMPWQWRHREHTLVGIPRQWQYSYELRSGDVQSRTATVQEEIRTWTRPWPPFLRVDFAIDVTFDGEVGERSGSWKGGCIGCSYSMLKYEDAYMALRRMERERKFE